jgi:peptidyl-prolyl cis-trans isomerase SurA
MRAIQSHILAAVGLGLSLAASSVTAQTSPPAANSTTAPATTQATPAAAPAAPVVLIDRVVAIVNDEAITRRELDDAVKNVTLQLQRQNIQLPPSDVLEKQVLERLINSRVQLQEAKDTDLHVDDIAVEKAIERIESGNNISIAQLQESLKKDGVDYAKFRDQIRDEITLARLRERDVDDRIVISDTEIDNFLKVQQEKGGSAEEFDLSHILIRVSDQASPEQFQQARARAEEAIKRIKAGIDFRLVAASFSDAPDATQGGALGWRESSQLPSMFADAITSLHPGEVTDILRSPNGFHILRLNDRRGQNAPVIVQQIHARHILVKTNEIVSEDEAKDRLLKIKDQLDHGADFANLARLQSEDVGSATRGGDLGWLSPGDTVPEFEKAMAALKPGEISEPVRSQFGWHLIQVLERRDADMTKDQQRLRARMALRAQKADEAYQNWSSELRDNAYVEYYLDSK